MPSSPTTVSLEDAEFTTISTGRGMDRDRCSSLYRVVGGPIRRFNNPQAYKYFVKSCCIIVGDGDVSTLREVQVISGLSANNSMERLDVLDEESHVISFNMLGDDHSLLAEARPYCDFGYEMVGIDE
ncbi:abscisic acid receptor PYL4-like [Rosa chinensis]|uniref:abscisic acid receptor PYL4-like n=1 Tax=Rosa chinensis TaxID=74649 RepID=UPI001AD8D424|nr:abscisic acid receptor PYL4-like [Rosa chinensis]